MTPRERVYVRAAHVSDVVARCKNTLLLLGGRLVETEMAHDVRRSMVLTLERHPTSGVGWSRTRSTWLDVLSVADAID